MVDIANHYEGAMRGNASMVEFGKKSFTTTGLTVEIPCGFSTLHDAIITPTGATNSREKFYCDLTSAGTVTVTRVVETRVQGIALDTGQISSTDLSATPLMIADNAMLLTEVQWVMGTAWGTTPGNFQLGTASDADAFIVATALTNTANTASTLTTFASHPADGDVIIASTTGAAGTDPADMSITIQYQIPTSGLEFTYQLLGIY